MSTTKKLKSDHMTLKYEFYQGGYRRLLNILLVMLGLNILIVWVIIFVKLDKPFPKFYSAASDGQIVEVYPIDYPYPSNNEVANWSSELVAKSYIYNAVNMTEKMTLLRQGFTPQGWQSYQSSTLPLRDGVKKQALKIFVEGVGEATVTKTGVFKGKRFWEVKTSLLLKKDINNQVSSQVIDVNLVIERVSLANSPQGIAVVNFVSKNRA